MSTDTGFNGTQPTPEALSNVLRHIVGEGLTGQRILPEHGVFEIDSTTCPEGPPPEFEEGSGSVGSGTVAAVQAPPHYTWLGASLATLGLSDAARVEAWDVLDAAFPSDPHLWNCGKYLLRLGRKGGEEKRLEDLRKARQYLDRAIERLENTSK